MKAFHDDTGAMSLPLDDEWLPLNASNNIRVSRVDVDPITTAATTPFDYTFTGETSFQPAAMPPLPDTFGIGLIVGASGTGKSTLLDAFGTPTMPEWESRASIASHFADADDATARLTAVGLSSVPTWCKPYHVLSNGEKFRADLARVIGDGAIIDEFTSVVDRNVAQAASKALRRWVNKHDNAGIVIATCHRDVIPWLEPDWIIDTDAQAYVLNPRGCLRRPPLVVRVHHTNIRAWRFFAPHHYMTADIHSGAKCFMASIDDQMCGFGCTLPFINRNLRNSFRTHRIVVLPDFQGFGIGPRFHDWMGSYYASRNETLYIKTIHPRFGAYLGSSPLWEPTSTNGKTHDYGTPMWKGHAGDRVSFSFRFRVDAQHRKRVDLGDVIDAEQPALFS